jgi:hypothetical protein
MYDVEDFEQDVKNLREMSKRRSLLEKKKQVELGNGDYTQERKDVLDSVSREEFWQDLQKIRNKKVN